LSLTIAMMANAEAMHIKSGLSETIEIVTEVDPFGVLNSDILRRVDV